MINSFSEAKKADGHIALICEEIGFVRQDYNMSNFVKLMRYVPGMFVDMPSSKVSSSETFHVFHVSYKRQYWMVISCIPHKDLLGSVSVFIENPFVIKSDDIQFICESMKEITEELSKKFARFQCVFFFVKENKEKVTHKIVRKTSRDESIIISLNIMKKNLKIELKKSSK